MEAFIGTILPVAFTYAPRGWMFCNGQTLQIHSYQALFALVSFTYGGDRQTNFAIPDLAGRIIIGSQGQGAGLNKIAQGEKGGASQVTVVGSGSVDILLAVNNLPPHDHTCTVNGSSFTATSTLKATTETNGGQLAAAGATLASTQGVTGAGQAAIYQTTTPAAASMMALNSGSVTTVVGGSVNLTTSKTGTGDKLSAPVKTTSTPVSIMPPYTGIPYIIAVEGLYPNRN